MILQHEHTMLKTDEYDMIEKIVYVKYKCSTCNYHEWKRVGHIKDVIK